VGLCSGGDAARIETERSVGVVADWGWGVSSRVGRELRNCPSKIKKNCPKQIFSPHGKKFHAHVISTIKCSRKRKSTITKFFEK